MLRSKVFNPPSPPFKGGELTLRYIKFVPPFSKVAIVERARRIIALILFLCFAASCENDFLYDPIPPVLVDETINLSNQEYLPLRQDGGFVEIVGGWKGILIYRENVTTYRAFEKASPHRFEEACAEIFVDPSGFFIKEGCDNTVYDFQGLRIR